MPTYAIGDIQGCYSAFRKLLDKIKFDPSIDQLWLVGDLVNRGGKSLETLRFIHSIAPNVTCVLGNHDFHLLAGQHQNSKQDNKPEFKAIYQASDSDELLHWLTHQPLMHIDESLRMVMVHAGLAPQWPLKKAQSLAKKVEKILQSDDKKRRKFFTKMYGNHPTVWKSDLDLAMELRVITNTFTRLRFCKSNGKMNYTDNGPPGSQKSSYQPWFIHPRKTQDYTIVFGHWSALGLYFGHQVMGLDTGCVWGGKLTAVRLGQDFKIIQVKGRRG